MYLVWKADLENEFSYTRASLEDPKSLRGKKLYSGQLLTDQLPDLRLELITAHNPADYFGVGPLFVVSARMREVLESARTNVEYIPVKLLRSGKEFDAGLYFFANIIEKKDCLDRENSVYQMDGEFVDKIEKLAIDEKKAAGIPLLRMANTYDVITLVKSELADLILASKMTGVRFEEPHSWKW